MSSGELPNEVIIGYSEGYSMWRKVDNDYLILDEGEEVYVRKSTILSANGGPAFMSFVMNPDGVTFQPIGGMTLRDYMATAALAGLLSNGNKDVVAAFGKHGETADKAFAVSAYAFAEAMIKERDKQ